MKQLEVQIMGQSYLLTCPENGELRLREAVDRVDSAMCIIRDIGKIKARDRIAVLAALNLTFELLQTLPAQAVAATPAPEPQAPPESPESPEPLAQADLPEPPRMSEPTTAPAQSEEQPGELDEAEEADKAEEKLPHPQLESLLQRLNTALGANGRDS